MRKTDKRATIFYVGYLRKHQNIACTTVHQLLGFIFNNASLFVNPWLDFLCVDGVNITKLRITSSFVMHCLISY